AGDGAVRQQHRQELIRPSAALLRAPADRLADGDADADGDEADLVAGELSNAPPDDGAEHGRAEAGDERAADAKPARAVGALRECLMAAGADQLPVHLVIALDDLLSAVGARRRARRRRVFDAIELQRLRVAHRDPSNG